MIRSGSSSSSSCRTTSELTFGDSSRAGASIPCCGPSAKFSRAPQTTRQNRSESRSGEARRRGSVIGMDSGSGPCRSRTWYPNFCRIQRRRGSRLRSGSAARPDVENLASSAVVPCPFAAVVLFNDDVHQAAERRVIGHDARETDLLAAVVGGRAVEAKANAVGDRFVEPNRIEIFRPVTRAQLREDPTENPKDAFRC
jgi:hypothetical protein